MIRRIPLDKRVWPGVIFFIALLVVERFYPVPFFAPLLWMLLAAHLLFFRDPHRNPSSQGLLAPADGKVIALDEVFEGRFLHDQAIRIRIFLSVFDAHTTHSPLSGIVKYQQYVRGKFFNALRKIAFEYNESNWIGIENHQRRVLVRQMTGAIARRIYSDVKIGQVMTRGEKMGIICYGSGVEFFVARKAFRPCVQIGQHVSAGTTLLGEWTDGTAS